MNGTRARYLPDTCSVTGCGRRYRSRGYCESHYSMWLKKTPAHLRPRPTILGRFESKYRQGSPTECWNWLADCSELGYGQFSVDRTTRVIASRFALMLATGSEPEDMFACHRCDNPSCVNPKHLYWGTVQDNRDDATARGRHPRGSKRAMSRLSEAQVLGIRTRYESGETGTSLAEEFGVSTTTIYRITSGQKWSHVGGPIVRKK